MQDFKWNIELDTSQAKANMLELTKSIDAGAKSIKEMGSTIDKSINPELNDITKNLSQLDSTVGLLSDSIKATPIGSLSVSFKNLSSTIDGLPADLKLTADETNELSTALSQASMGIQQATVLASENTLTLGSMKNALKDLEAQLLTMEVGTPQFQAAQESAFKLRDEIDKVSGKVNEFGEREPRNQTKKALDDAFIAATTLTGAMGSMSLALGDNENAQEAVAKATAGVAVAQTAANLVKEKGAIIDTLTIVKTKALSAAKVVYTGVMKGATKATRSFSAALVATGFGAVLVGLGLLISDFKSFIGIIDKAQAAVKGFAKETLGLSDNLIKVGEAVYSVINPLYGLYKLYKQFSGTKLEIDVDALREAKDGIDAIISSTDARYDKEIELAKAAGKETTKLEKEKLDARIKTNEQIWNEAQRLHGLILASGRQLTDEEIKLYNESKEAYEDSVHQRNLLAVSSNKKAADDQISLAKAIEELRIKLMNEGRAKELAELDLRFKEEAAKYKGNAEYQKLIAENRAKETQEINARYDKIASDNAAEVEALKLEQAKETSDKILEFRASTQQIETQTELSNIAYRLAKVNELYANSDKLNLAQKTDLINKSQELQLEALQIESANRAAAAELEYQEASTRAKEQQELELSELDASLRAKHELSTLTGEELRLATEAYELELAEAKRLKEEEERNLELEIQREHQAKLTQINQDSAQKEKDIAEKTKDELIKIKEAETQRKIALANVYTDAIIGSAGNIVNAIGAFSEEGTEQEKNLKIAGATIDTISGAISAYMGAQSLGVPLGPIFGAINAAAATAMGIANIAKIKNTKINRKNNSGGSTLSGLSTGSAAPSTPSVPTINMFGNPSGAATTNISSVIDEPDEGPVTVKAIVSWEDIQTVNQNSNQVIDRNTL